MLRAALRSCLPLLAALTLAACQPTADTSDLRVVLVGPAVQTQQVTRQLVTEATQATLIARDGQGRAVPGLASSWRFVDGGRTLILRLKPVKWSDGKPLAAADVVASFRRALSPPKGTRSSRPLPRHGLIAIDNAIAVAGGKLPPARLGVFAPTTRVVEIRMNAAMPVLLDWLAQPEFAVTRAGKAPPALGAYREARTEAGTRLVRIADGPQPHARPARIELRARDDSRAAAAAFAAGQADIVASTGINGLAAAQVAARPAALRVEHLWGTYGYLANTRYGPLADARVRQALAMAVDRAEIAAGYGEAGIVPLTGLVPPALASGVPIRPVWAALDETASLALARQLLGESGFGESRALRLTILLPPGDDHRSIAGAVARAWARIGVLVSTTQLEPAELARAFTRGDFDLVLDERSVPAADRGALLRALACTRTGYCNPAADALVDSARLLPPAAASAALSQAESLMLADVPLVPLIVPVRWALVAPRVTGWNVNPAGAHPLGQLGTDGAGDR